MRGKLSYKLPLSLAAAAVVVGTVLSPVAGASDAPVATWTGAAGDNRFSTAGNWKEGTVPVNGAKLVLPCKEDSPLTLTNDLSNVKFGGIEAETTQKDNGPGCAPTTIDTIDFADSVVFTKNDYRSATRVTLVKATGAAERIQFGTDSLGSFSLQNNTAKMMTNHLVITGGASLWDAQNVTPKKSVDLSSASVGDLKKLDKDVIKTLGNLRLSGESYDGDFILKKNGRITANVAYSYNQEKKENTVTETRSELSGKITLLGDATYYVSEGAGLKLSGSIEGEGFKLSPSDGSWGDFENATKTDNSGTPKGKQEFKAEEVDLKKECSVKRQGFGGEYIGFTIGRNQFATLSDDAGCSDASGYIVVDGLLKGVGTVRFLTVNGTLAPGNSPGVITVSRQLTFNTNLSVFNVEILNKDTHDKVIVGKDYEDQHGGNAVWITTGATLKLTYLPDGKLKKGDVLTIIDNQSKTDVKGEFKDMPEGAEVRVGNATFIISYKGGDGNDVTLTAQNDSVAPKAPNTGAASLVANPAVAVAGVAAAVVALFASSKRHATNKR